MKDFRAVVLAGGKGTRMKASIPKVLYKISGRPMVGYVLDAVRSAGIKNITVVTGYKSELLKNALKGRKGIGTVKQKKFLGSADALLESKTAFKNYNGNILVIYGDSPLIKTDTLEKLIDTHLSQEASLTLLTATLPNPTSYGRVVRDDKNQIVKIAEEVDCSVFEKAIEEINVGVYCFKAKELFRFLSQIKNDNEKKEYFLTDIVSIMHRSN